MDSWKLSTTQTALVNFSGLQNKTKRHDCDKDIFKEEGRDWQVWRGDKRPESESNQNVYIKYKIYSYKT